MSVPGVALGEERLERRVDGARLRPGQASIQPLSAPTRHSATRPISRPIWMPTISQVGRVRRTGCRASRHARGRRHAAIARTRRLDEAGGRGCVAGQCAMMRRHRRLPARRGLIDRAQREVPLCLRRREMQGVVAHAAQARPPRRGRSLSVWTMRPGALDLPSPCTSSERKIAFLLDVMGDEDRWSCTEIAPATASSHSCICSLALRVGAPNGSSSRITSVSNRSVRSRRRAGACRPTGRSDRRARSRQVHSGAAAAAAPLRAWRSGDAPGSPCRVDDIVDQRALRQQQILLQHVADAADRAGRIETVDQHPASGRLLQARHDVEDRALALAWTGRSVLTKRLAGMVSVT